MSKLRPVSAQSVSSPIMMGILNVTPDSFYDGGRYGALKAAIAQAERMIEEGAGIIDIGGESTRPGAEAVSQDVELARVLPVVRALVGQLPPGVILSVDTQKPAVMQAVIEAGVDMINDVSALSAPGAVEVVARAGVLVCLMHGKDPVVYHEMQLCTLLNSDGALSEPQGYRDMMQAVKDYLARRIDVCLAAGIQQDKLVIDPGFGFAGKTHPHQAGLLGVLSLLKTLECPILVGISHKNLDSCASIQAAKRAVEQGAHIVRVHEVGKTAEVLRELGVMGQCLK